MYFQGTTFSEDLDGERLRTQLFRVVALMEDGQWRTLKQVAFAVDGSEASVSARLRDLRKPQFGNHKVEKMRVADGLWVYRLIMNSTNSGVLNP